MRRARLVQTRLVLNLNVMTEDSDTIRNAGYGIDELAGISRDYEVFFAETVSHQQRDNRRLNSSHSSLRFGCNLAES